MRVGDRLGLGIKLEIELGLGNTTGKAIGSPKQTVALRAHMIIRYMQSSLAPIVI